jgi:hypothetical protein
MKMKNLILFISTMLVISLPLKSQFNISLNKGESAVVYSLPKTEFCVEIVTEKTTQRPGLFYRYSERYLATKKVTARPISDPNRTFPFSPDKSVQHIRLTVNSQGILCGVNVNCEPEKAVEQKAVLTPKEVSKPDVILPLGEDYMMVGSEAKLAEGVAKQIYRIRESRLSLLTADVDKMPADGASFKSMLEGQDKMERELTEFFLGKTTTETQAQTIVVTPASAVNNQVLFRLSAFKGIVAADDLSGVPYYINIVPENSAASQSDTKFKFDKSNLYTLLPVSTQFSINDGINTLYSQQFFVPQFGKLLPLAENILKQSNLKVIVDSFTGRLLSIE